ncbi:hypothetical protein PHYBOEH_004679 [Phytophthora boehmeriae]|uniref:Uncharacterized protein n=1 Tax=Phytophthora boehmeriae TaxID=109152 RepID=A0A8T1WS95_9STRA|nr:hypothetical protein PHYBOEH_004679 [Phytophthora boehmeriae]
MGDSRDGGGVSLQAGDVTLALRGERIPLRHAVSSAFNHSRHELLVATPPALCLYGKMLTAGGDLLATLEADEGLHFQAVLYLPWLDAYSVIVVLGNGKIEHRIVSTDLKTSLTSHTIIEKDGQIFTALANPHRRELITADSDGGLKVWALRVLSTAQNNGGFKGVLRLHTAAISTRKPYYRHARMSFNFKWIFAATSTRVLECGSYDNSVYLVFKDNLRKICKYSFMKKGSLQFRPIAEYTHDQDLAVFIENCQRPSVSIPSHISPHQDINSGNGVVIVDCIYPVRFQQSYKSSDNLHLASFCHSKW